MNRTKKVLLVTAIFSLLIVSLVACGSNNSASTGTTSTASAGTVTLYTADGLEAYYKQVIPHFESQYHAKVNIVTDGSGAVVNRLQIEKNNPQADVVVTLPPFVQNAEQGGLLTPFTPDAASHIPATRKSSQDDWYTFIDNYITWVYNPQLVTNPPQTFSDLTSPAYKNEIAYSNPISAGDGMAVIIELEAVWGQQKTFAFLKALEPSIKFHTKGTGYLDVLVNRGEIHAANGDLQMDLSDKVQGGMSLQPLFLRPAAGQAPVTFEDPYAIGLVKNSPNTRGGQDLINFLLSKQAQQQVWSVYGAPARDDIPAIGQNAQELANDLKGVQVLQINWVHVLQSQQTWEKLWQTEVANAYGKPSSVSAPAS